jgi:glycerophosphoryl diester phosphodiesterase
MVDTREHITHHYTIEEQTLRSKTDNEEDCEDAVYAGPHFVAVIDGATSKTQRRWQNRTGGKMAAILLQEAFARIPPEATLRQAVDILTSAIRAFYEENKVIKSMRIRPAQRITASFVAFSLFRREIWFVGDCQCLLNQELISNKKIVDEITANARSLFLEGELCRGKTIDELLQKDTGRVFILRLLRRQMLFQNNPSSGQYWYPVIDGFDVPEDGLRVISLPGDIETIVLASDGYPYLKDSLQASEDALQEILRDDPLLFRKYKSTKGLQKKNVSFDDRAYVKVRLTKATGDSSLRSE